MGNTNNKIAVLTAVLVLAVSGRSVSGNTDVALAGWSSVVTHSLGGVDTSMPILALNEYTRFCIDDLAQCLPEQSKRDEPIWGPKPGGAFCAGGPAGCQANRPKKAALTLPKTLKPRPDRISLGALMLAPMAHSLFCLQNPTDCEVRKIAFRSRMFELTTKRWKDLREVNAAVNRGIRPERNTLSLAGERWLIHPKAGDCNDYAVTKQHELLARGWPSRTLLLAEVVTHWGEHHLILVVRTGKGDFVLDNLNANIRPWSKTRYQWVRVQSPRNPKWWAAIRSGDV